MKNAKNEKIEKFYSIYKIILKEGAEEIKEDNIKDLKIISIADDLQQVADILNYNKKYLSSIKTIKNRYKIIDNKYIIYIDNTEDVI